MKDTYDEALKLLKALNPSFREQPGERVTLVAALIQPSEDYLSMLAWRRLVDDYRATHAAGCSCALCERARELAGGKKAAAMLELPLEVAG